MTTLTQPRPRLSRPIPGFDDPRLRLFDADEFFAMRDADIFAEKRTSRTDSRRDTLQASRNRRPGTQALHQRRVPRPGLG